MRGREIGREKEKEKKRKREREREKERERACVLCLYCKNDLCRSKNFFIFSQLCDVITSTHDFVEC